MCIRDSRSIGRAQPLVASGALVATSVADAVRDAEVVITTLFDAAAVLSVAEQTVEAMLLGTRGPAETGRLVLLVAGDPALRERLEPVFAAISEKVVWAGETIGQGTALKLACNAWITTLTAAVGQSLALAGGLGLDPNLFLEAIAGGPSDTPYAHVKGSAMLSAPGETQFALDGARKDLVLIEEAIGRAGIHASLVAAVRDLYDRSAADGHGGEDISSVIAGFRPGDAAAR